MDPTLLRDLAKAGLAAPSADNRHRFQLVPAGQHSLRVVGESDLFNGMSRHRRLLTLFSLGSVVENIALRAAERAMVTQVHWLPEGEGPCVALLEFNPGGSVAGMEAMAAAIPERHTNRRMYSGPRLIPGERDSLDRAAQFGGVQFEWLEGQRRKAAHALIWKAETERFRRPALHEELFGSIRFELDWRSSTDEGLPPAALEVEAPMRPIFKVMRHWPVMKALTFVGAHYMLGVRAGLLPCAQAPELGVISSPRPPTEAALITGRSFQRLWLQAAALGLALQPMAASAVLLFQDDVPGGMDPAVREHISAGWRAMLGDSRPMMVFRLGRAAPATTRTLRPDVETVLTGAAIAKVS